jgi:hypothetical protein
MRRRGLVVAALLGLALAPAPARGKCAMPAAVIVPPDGAALPPKPVLYAFVPGGFGKRPADALPLTIVDGAGAKVSFRVTRLGEAPAFAAYRIEVDARAGSRITVKLTQQMYREVTIARTYAVAGDWKRPARGATAVTKVTHESHRWTCSHQLSQNLTPGRFAPAYRVEWAETEKAWRDGKRERLFLPYSKAEFWNWRNEKVPQAALLELGHLDCMGSTFEWKGKPIYVGVAALHPDGSEDPPAAEPVKVSPP